MVHNNLSLSWLMRIESIQKIIFTIFSFRPSNTRIKRQVTGNRIQVSISSTFDELIFRAIVLCKDFLYLRFGFVTFWSKNICRKVASKMLMKLSSFFAQNCFAMAGGTLLICYNYFIQRQILNVFKAKHFWGFFK